VPDHLSGTHIYRPVPATIVHCHYHSDRADTSSTLTTGDKDNKLLRLSTWSLATLSTGSVSASSIYWPDRHLKRPLRWQ
jgi:hypothetical protein